MYLGGKHQYFIETVLDILRKATVAQVGETVGSRCFTGITPFFYRPGRTNGDIPESDG